MAYRTFQKQTSEAIYSSSISCLDGIPFKIGANYQPPSQINLPPNLTKPVGSSALHSEYSFETEEGVLQWADDRQKQIEAQRKLAEEIQLANQKREQEHQESSSDSETDDEWLANNQTSASKPASYAENKVPSSKAPLQPLIAGISSDILTPTPINPGNNSSSDQQSTNNVDITLFENEEDPFDRYERQTLNDLEELKSVFSTADTNNSESHTNGDKDNIYENVSDLKKTNRHKKKSHRTQESIANSTPVQKESDGEDYNYVQLVNNVQQTQAQETSVSQVDLNKLPPVHHSRNFLANKILPPIGGSKDSENRNTTVGVSDSSSKQLENSESDNIPIYENYPEEPLYGNVMIAEHGRVSFNASGLHQSNLNSSDSSRPNVLPAKTSHEPEPPPPAYDNLFTRGPRSGAMSVENARMRNALSSPDISNTNPWNIDTYNRTEEPQVVLSKTPPPRPSSQQSLPDFASWNRYSPLPLPVNSNQGATQSVQSSNCSSNSDLSSPSEINPYLHFSPEAKTAVDNLVAMGFSRPLAIRAVEIYGKDEKEVVDYLCGVNKLSEKGFDMYLSETSMKLFKNNLDKAEIFLTLMKQFKELGFSQDKIQDALVSNELDRDKALDVLTA